MLKIPALPSTALLLLMSSLGKLVVPLYHLPPSLLDTSPALRFCSHLLGEFLKHNPWLGWNHLKWLSRNLYDQIVFSGLRWYEWIHLLWVAKWGSNLMCTCGLDAGVFPVSDSLEHVKLLSQWKLARGSCLCPYTPIQPELNGAWSGCPHTGQCPRTVLQRTLSPVVPRGHRCPSSPGSRASSCRTEFPQRDPAGTGRDCVNSSLFISDLLCAQSTTPPPCRAFTKL